MVLPLKQKSLKNELEKRRKIVNLTGWDEQRVALHQFLVDTRQFSREEIDSLLRRLPFDHPQDQDLWNSVSHKVEVVEQMSSGGMGTLYKVFHQEHKKYCALKVAHTDAELGGELEQRLNREAGILQQLKHPHIVEYLDHFLLNAKLSLCMEWINSGDLEECIWRQGVFAERQAVELIATLADAMVAYAEQGIIHRDIKPSNILWGASRKLIDFGIAKQATQQGGTIEFIGTPDYSSPEQINQGPLDIRSDIYSLGVVFYFCLAGRPPFFYKNPQQACRALYDAEKNGSYQIPPMQNKEGEPILITADTQHLLQKMMALKPEDRYANPRELLEVCQHLLGHPPGEPRRSIVSPPKSSPGKNSTTPEMEEEIVFLEEKPTGKPVPPSLLQEQKKAKALLTVRETTHRLFIFIGDQLRFGRKADSEVEVSLRLLPTDDPQNAQKTSQISKIHGVFSYHPEQEKFCYEDRSSSGSILNGQKVEPQKMVPLPSPSLLTVGEALDLQVLWKRCAAIGLLLINRLNNTPEDHYLLLTQLLPMGLTKEALVFDATPHRAFVLSLDQPFSLDTAPTAPPFTPIETEAKLENQTLRLEQVVWDDFRKKLGEEKK